MKVLNRSNIFFLIAVIVLSSMIFYTSHYGWPFSSDAMSTAEHLGAVPFLTMEVVKSNNPFIDVVILISGLLFMGTFFFSDDKKSGFFFGG